MIGYAFLLGLGALYYYYRSFELMATLLSDVAFTLSCIMGFLILNILSTGQTLMQMRSDPYRFILDLVARSLTFHHKYISRLAASDVGVLQYVLAHYRYERVAFEKRGGVLSGAIDRIGIFPALASLAGLAAALSHFGIWSTWLEMLVPLILAFHLLNLIAFGMQQKMDGVIALLEYSIESR